MPTLNCSSLQPPSERTTIRQLVSDVYREGDFGFVGISFFSQPYLCLTGGIKGFWRGNGVNVMKIAPETALKFLLFDQACTPRSSLIHFTTNLLHEQTKRYIANYRNHAKVTTTDRFMSAAFAGAVAQSIIYPLEVIKVR